MDLVQLAKDPDSGRIGCPSVHFDRDSGHLVFEGPAVDMAYLPTPLPGEQAVSLHPDIVREAARAMGWL